MKYREKAVEKMPLRERIKNIHENRLTLPFPKKGMAKVELDYDYERIRYHDFN